MSFHSFDQNIYPKLLLYTQTTTATSAYVNPFTNFNRCYIMLLAAAVGTTLDMKLVQATSSAGAGSKDVTDAAAAVLDITQLAATEVGLQGLDFGPGVLDQANSFTHVAVTVTAAGTCAWDVIAFYYQPRYPGGTTHDTTYRVANSARLYARGGAVSQG